MVCVFFFVKKKTAYEMSISDGSSDVCASDLLRVRVQVWGLGFGVWGLGLGLFRSAATNDCHPGLVPGSRDVKCWACGTGPRHKAGEIGRASCRERVCQYV